MSALDQLWAPDVLPDTASAEYQAVLAILEDHPVTAGMDHNARASLAQRCADAVTEVTEVERLADDREEAYEALVGPLNARTLSGERLGSIPHWVRARWIPGAIHRVADALDTVRPGWTAGIEVAHPYRTQQAVADIVKQLDRKNERADAARRLAERIALAADGLGDGGEGLREAWQRAVAIRQRRAGGVA